MDPLNKKDPGRPPKGTLVTQSGAEEEDALVAIIDAGSGLTKVGMSSDEKPMKIFPSAVGLPRRRHRKKCDRDFFCGDEVFEHVEHLTVCHPIEGAVIENFQQMEMLWDYIFVDLLQIQPEKHPVLLTEPPFNPKPNRERMCELMFEAFGVPKLNISIQGVLSLMGQGRTTGLVLDSGHGVTHAVPIYDGYGLPYSIKKLELAGNELNVYLAKLLSRAGIPMTSTTDRIEVQKMKEKLCYVSLSPEEESVSSPISYTMPDGEVIQLCDEIWKAPEALFSPGAIGLETGSGGVAGLLWDCVAACEIDIRRTLLQNIVLSGGCTMFKNFDARLSKELTLMSSSQLQCRVVTRNEERRDSVWRGGQVFANLTQMQQDSWMTAQDYDECGVQYIHEKTRVKHA